MSKEIVNMIIFSASWAVGLGVLFLFLKNKWSDIQFRNVSSSFLLSGAIGLVAAFAGSKANISFWLTWIIFAAAAAYVTYRLLNKKQEGAPRLMEISYDPCYHSEIIPGHYHYFCRSIQAVHTPASQISQ